MDTEAGAPGTGASGILGIALQENCTSRCWFAHREPCRCPCGGQNHGAMQPGSTKLTGPNQGSQLQTIMGMGDLLETPPEALQEQQQARADGPAEHARSTDQAGTVIQDGIERIASQIGWRPRPEDVYRAAVRLARGGDRSEDHARGPTETLPGERDQNILDQNIPDQNIPDQNIPDVMDTIRSYLDENIPDVMDTIRSYLDENILDVMDTIRSYLDEEYGTPGGLQERLDLEAEACAAEIISRMTNAQRDALETERRRAA